MNEPGGHRERGDDPVTPIERGSGDGLDRSRSRRVLTAALSVTMVSTFPPLLAGALAVEILPDLGFDEAALGVAVGGFFALSALGSFSIGGLVDRRGWAPAMRASAAISAAAMIGIAFLAHSWVSFAALLSLGGLTMAVGNPAVNRAIAREIPMTRQGFVFGVKHSAVPVAALLSGLALPVFALTIGWRPVFAGAGVIAALVVVVVPPTAPTGEKSAPGRREEQPTIEMRPLVLMAVGAALAAAVASALSAFFVISVVDSGISAGAAGLMLAAASVTGLGVRLSAGRWADLRGAGGLGGVAVLLIIGSIGIAALAGSGAGFLTLAGLVAFGAGWGWNGLFNFAVVKHYQEAPARATSIALTGTYTGAAMGPIVFGFFTRETSFEAAWIATAVLAVGAAFAMLVARSYLNKADLLAPH